MSTSEPAPSGLRRLVKEAFADLARWRSARAFHPVGTTFAGRLTVASSDATVGKALGGDWPVLVRASKGVGTPKDWPDFHGLAVRVEHAVGPVDLLFTTVNRRLPYLLAPSRGWCTQPYTTFLPYSADGTHVLLRLEPDDTERAGGSEPVSIRAAVTDREVTFGLQESEGATWSTVGELRLQEPAGMDIAFDPIRHQHPRLRHPRLIGQLRRWAYAGSRRGRESDVTDEVARRRKDPS